MKITIIRSEKDEKRYTRVDVDDFVKLLREGSYLSAVSREPLRQVCFAAEWQKQNGELKVKEVNHLVLLSLENLRDLPTAEDYKRQASRCSTTVR